MVPFSQCNPSIAAPSETSETKLNAELEKARITIRRLSDCLGTTVVQGESSSSDDLGDDLGDNNSSSQLHDIDQNDSEFAKNFNFTTNVIPNSFSSYLVLLKM